MTLLRRIVVEKRAVLVPLVLAVVANLAAYGFLLRPLQARVSSAEARKAQAESNRRGAERQLSDARAVQSGKERAESDLQTFYRRVLPTGVADARKSVYLRLAQLARESDLKLQRQSGEEIRDQKDSALMRLRLTVVLEGDYEDVRRFLHAVETAPEFVIVDTVGLMFRSDSNTPLALTLSVSTYFWAGVHEA